MLLWTNTIYINQEHYLNMRLFVNNNESKIIILSDGQVTRLSEAADKYFSSNDLDGMSSSSELITKPRSDNRKEHKARISHFKLLKDYCVKHLGNPIASGSSRLVFQIDDEKVLKLAYNSAGIAQNKEEALWDKQQYNFIPKIFQIGKNYEWIVCEYVLPAEFDDFKHCIGINWIGMKAFIETVYSLYSSANAPLRYSVMDDLIDEHEILADLSDYMYKNRIPSGDITRIENWGLAKRNGEAYPVLLDHGFNLEVYKNFYTGGSSSDVGAATW